MYLEKRVMNQATVLDCYGRFREEDNEQFMEAFESLQAQGCPYLVINMTSIYHVDANIINLLMFARDFFTSNGSQMTLVSPMSPVRRELERAEVPKMIPMYVTVYDSLHRRNAVMDKEALGSSASKSMSIDGAQPLDPEIQDDVEEDLSNQVSEMVGAGTGTNPPNDDALPMM